MVFSIAGLTVGFLRVASNAPVECLCATMPVLVWEAECIANVKKKFDWTKNQEAAETLPLGMAFRTPGAGLWWLQNLEPKDLGYSLPALQWEANQTAVYIFMQSVKQCLLHDANSTFSLNLAAISLWLLPKDRASTDLRKFWYGCGGLCPSAV